MALLAFTAAQESAQRKYREFCRGPVTTMPVLYGPLSPFYQLVDARQARDAADFAENFEAETLGFTQYRGCFDGPVHLIELKRRYCTKGGTHFQAGELAIAVMRPADQYADEAMVAWSPRTGIHVSVVPRAYRLVETVPARG